MKKYEGLGKLVAFSILVAVLAFALVLGADELDVPRVGVALIIFVLVFGLAWALRRQESGRWSYEIRRYEAEVDGRRVELLFDERLTLLNRLSLVIDGETVDRGSIFYGTKTLTAESAGSPLSVEVGSGWVGTCTGAIVRSGSTERPMRDVTASAA